MSVLKKTLKWGGIVLGAIVLLLGGFALFIQLRGIPSYSTKKIDLHVEVTPARVEQGRRWVSMLCAGCHYDQSTGRLSGKQMADLPAIFGKAWSRNITQDPELGIGSWTDGDIAYLLRTGVKKNGVYAPPWMVKLPNMADEDLYSIIAFLRSDDTLVQALRVRDHESEPSWFAKFLCLVAFKPFEYPSAPIALPDTTNRVARGKYLVSNIGCYTCHSADFSKLDELHIEKTFGFFGGGNQLTDASGRQIMSPNLTPDMETGIGSWTEAQFVQTVKTGIRANHTPLRFPMERVTELSDYDLGNIYQYLRTVPPIHNAVARPVVEAAANASEGEKVYVKYGCYGCHGNAGVGTCDLRQAYRKYPTNDSLIAWIKNPLKYMPGSKMPTWDGTIQESEYAPLCEYVRKLGENASQGQAAMVP